MSGSLASICAGSLLAEEQAPTERAAGSLSALHHPAKAKRVIFLCQSGAPSQIDLFDPKPTLLERGGEELPASVRKGQRLTTMTSKQTSLPLIGSSFTFEKHGECGRSLSELLPYTSKIVDKLCFIDSMHTDAINHDPAITLLQTGHQQPGRPSLGSWVSYGLGTLRAELPSFVVMLSGGKPGDQPLYGRLWSSAFLPGKHQGVQLRGGREPVLYLSNPPGIDRAARRAMVDTMAALDRLGSPRLDPDIESRIDQYELALGMQDALPKVADFSGETQETLDLYGPDVKTPGTFAANCLLARRLVENGVRFVQLYHRDWDHHTKIDSRIQETSLQTDQPSAALVADLARHGLLEDTLVIWGGEFGRTSYSQNDPEGGSFGRDHHPRCFSIWMAGGGVRPGYTLGKTDEFSYNIIDSPVHVHDLQATILHLLGIDHLQLTYRTQGRDFRLTDVAGEVVTKVLG